MTTNDLNKILETCKLNLYQGPVLAGMCDEGLILKLADKRIRDNDLRTAIRFLTMALYIQENQ